jgi:hypothetical protein
VRRGEPVARLDVDARYRLRQETVEIRPPAVPLELKHEVPPVLDHAQTPAELVDLRAGPQRHRLEECPEPEPDVREPLILAVPDAEHQVRARPHDSARRTDTHPREQQVDLRAQRLVRVLQQQVLLEAVAAAAAGDELLLDVRSLERHRDPPVRIEVLERDGGELAEMHLGQARPAVQADPREIRLEVVH